MPNQTEISNVEELKTINNGENSSEEPKGNDKKKSFLKFFLYFLLVIVLTALALWLSLKDCFNDVIFALKQCDYRYLFAIAGLVAGAFALEALVLFIFTRLYTKKYSYPQAMATNAVGVFYSAVTPGASGGQVMQVYTMKKQGVQTSNAASIMVMTYIVYQITLVFWSIIAVVFNWELIKTIPNFDINLFGNVISLPVVVLTFFGFGLNVIVLAAIFLMSYSRTFHKFVMNVGIGFLAKIKLIKNPDKKREELGIQVENFRIELRRLLSNVPIFILVFVIFSLMLIMRFGIPYFAGLALDGYGYRQNLDGSLVLEGGKLVYSTGNLSVGSFWASVFLSSYHQMMTGLIPLPGAAFTSEVFFNLIFKNFYKSQQITTAAQIIWRTATFYAMLLITGIFASIYRATPKGEFQKANKQEFVTVQLATLEIRKAESDLLYSTSKLSTAAISEKLKSIGKKKDKVDTGVHPIVVDEKKVNEKVEEKPQENIIKPEVRINDYSSNVIHSTGVIDKENKKEEKPKKKTKIVYREFDTGDDD